MSEPSRPAAVALERVRIVLCHTSLPANIGAAARAMKTMGLAPLYLVDPRHFPHADAEALASRATDILAAARVCATLDEALAGTVYAVASTARNRDMSHPVLTPREAAARMVEEAQRGPVALVLGAGEVRPDRGGGQPLQRHRHGAGQSRVLLAQSGRGGAAVRLRDPAGGASRSQPLPQQSFEAATFEEIEMFYTHLEQTLLEIGFINPKEPKRLMQRMRRLFARVRLEREEVNILRGILNMAQEHARAARRPKS